MAGTPMTDDQARAALMAKIEVQAGGGCWVWIGATKGNGYGHTSRGSAHRRSYQLFVGPIPAGMDVCHHCDNRPCINPQHLFVGTRRENMADCKRKGRTAKGLRLGDRRGERSTSAKLTLMQVRAIRASDAPSKILAAQFGVTNDNINRIRRNDTWKVA